MEMYSHELSEEDLLQLRRVRPGFFAERARDEMDQLWQTQDWSDATMEEWLADDELGEAS